MKPFIFIILSALIITSSHSCGPVTESGSTDQTKQGLTVLFSFNPESYPRIIRKAYPQIAVWVMQKEINYSQTLYATASGSKDSWWGADTRPGALPVWYGIRKTDTASKIDAITGATPSGESFSVRWSVPRELIGKIVDVYIEANVSFDYNEHYPKKAVEGDEKFSGVNGQPSLIWAASVKLADEEQNITPEIAGHGHVLGKDHTIHPNLSKITTARGLFHYIKVLYEPAKKQ